MGIELVRNEKKTPLPMNLAESIVRRAFEVGLVLLPGHGLQKGGVGDLLILAPPLLFARTKSIPFTAFWNR
jgi:4-aminobutyrate aminotransferase-like enzyme